jgi:hypothetical protein
MISLIVSAARSSSELYSSSLMLNSFSAAFDTPGCSDGGTPSMSMIVSIGSTAVKVVDDLIGAGDIDFVSACSARLCLDPANVARRERRADQVPVDGVLRRIHRQEDDVASLRPSHDLHRHWAKCRNSVTLCRYFVKL